MMSPAIVACSSISSSRKATAGSASAPVRRRLLRFARTSVNTIVHRSLRGDEVAGPRVAIAGEPGTVSGCDTPPASATPVGCYRSSRASTVRSSRRVVSPSLVNTSQVVLDGLRADEELAADLRFVRPLPPSGRPVPPGASSRPGKRRHVGGQSLPWRESSRRLRSANTSAPVGEPSATRRCSRASSDARVATSRRRPGGRGRGGRRSGALQPFDRLAVAVGSPAGRRGAPRTSQDPERPVGSPRACVPRARAAPRRRCAIGGSAPRLDQLDSAKPRTPISSCSPRVELWPGLVVPTQSVVEERQQVAGLTHRAPSPRIVAFAIAQP